LSTRTSAARLGFLQPYTLHPAPYTLQPTPYTLHPTPCTLHPAPCTLHLTPLGFRRQSVSARFDTLTERSSLRDSGLQGFGALGLEGFRDWGSSGRPCQLLDFGGVVWVPDWLHPQPQFVKRTPRPGFGEGLGTPYTLHPIPYTPRGSKKDLVDSDFGGAVWVPTTLHPYTPRP
jgi:hypothetical protein